MEKFIATQEFLDMNPGIEELGIKVGDVVSYSIEGDPVPKDPRKPPVEGE